MSFRPHTAEIVREDIAFVRDLVEAGETPAPLVGAALVAMGLANGAACLVVLAYDSGLLHLPDAVRHWLFAGASGAWAGCVAALKLRWSGRPARLDRNLSAVGLGLGTAGCIFMVCAGAIMHRTDASGEVAVMHLLLPTLLALYGAGWIAAGALARRRWMWLVALASFCAAVLSATTFTDAPYLVFGASFFLIMAAPGLVMLAEARSNRLPTTF